MTQEFLRDSNMEEATKQFDMELREYVELVNSIDDADKLNEMEQELLKEQDEVNAYLKTTQYQLPDGVDFDGEHYTVKDIANKVIYFINKKEVEWKYTLGLYQLVKFWKTNNPSIIDYGVYDSTLRMLNQIPFQGFSEWRDILACNEYFKSAHDSYSKDTSWLIFVSEKHNAILDKLSALGALNNELEE
jgi:hypothetical protein